MAIADAHGLPLALLPASASPCEVTLVEETLLQCPVGLRPERLIGDKAYDSDALDRRLLDQGTKLIAPHRGGRLWSRYTQDGRELRRFKRRWKIERLFAWLHNSRRLVVRYEYHLHNYLGFLHLAAALILLRHL
jgi:transposase